MKLKLLAAGITVVLALSAVPVFADSTSGGGGSSDPTFPEGVAEALGGTVTAGDVVVCAVASPCSLTDTSTWSDVVDFYNPTNGPFVADTNVDATYVEAFSNEVSGSGSLAYFLANYVGPFPPAVVPVGNFVVENSDGSITYGAYSFYLPQATPEPGTLSLLLIGGLVGLGMAGRKLSWS